MNNKIITLPIRIAAVAALAAGIGRAVEAHELYGAEYAYHSAVPLLPICLFFCLFGLLMPKQSVALSVIAVLAGFFTASLI